MVAYNFPAWFEPPILSGAKKHTVRRPKKAPGRHAAPGDNLRLYTGLRTKAARVMLETVCVAAWPVDFVFPERLGQTAFTVGGDPVDPEEFARADGFRDLAHMREFWMAANAPRGATMLDFQGTAIFWP